MQRQQLNRSSCARLGLAALLLGLLWLLPAPAQAVSACGGEDQRACCFLERAAGACDSGLREEAGCSGDCTCAGGLASSSGTCRRPPPPPVITACGGENQRACCFLERDISLGACDPGTTEVAGCSGNCLCKGATASSSGTCRAITACGGPGQRACCFLERAGGACDAGTSEVAGCSGNCLCKGGTANSSGTCKAVTACGGEGQRACCTTEKGPFTPPCNGTLSEVGTCTGDCRCSGTGNSLGMCRQLTSCGGEGERACCFLERVPSCDPGLFEMPFCSGDCQCKAGGSSSGTCARPTPCGGKGQRACCLIERSTPCDGGLTYVEGCSGDCFCKGTGEKSSGSCTFIELMNEPGTQFTPMGPPQCPMRGYADLHLHLFGELAHGGGVLAGKAYDEGGVNRALAQDLGTNADLVTNKDKELPAPSCPSYLPSCGKVKWHGGHGLLDEAIGDGTKDGAGSNLGAPLFNGWPTWTSTTHQQAYYKWLERAYRGGLRLTVMLAVTNESLCKLAPHLRGTSCEDSMGPIDAQLDAARRFEDFIDRQSGGAGRGWFRIVETPAAARRAIRDGKLAVVLGIEVAALFNCKNSANCTEAFVRGEVQRYQKKGVRHIFPIHNFDNGFGAAATWQDSINLGNALAERRYWETENCQGQGYGFWLDTLSESFTALLGGVAKGLDLPATPTYPNGDRESHASCNRFGLKPLGAALIDELMKQKILIDIDHMSNRSLDDTLALTRPVGYPLVASHVQVFDLYEQSSDTNFGRHERMRTRAQLQAIRDSGGMIAVMLKDDVQDTALKGKRTSVPYGGKVADDCRYSSRAFAQMYEYAMREMRGGPIAFGSDFNGIAGHLGPRFGSEACGGDGLERSAQARSGTRLSYPFSEPGFGSFDKQVTGQKTFDYNVDGLAHIGLLPDLVADLRRVGLSEQDLNPLMRSAEGYIEVWERAEGTGGGATRTRCVSKTVEAGSACGVDVSIADPSLQEDPTMTLTQMPAGPYGPGTREVTLTARPPGGCGEPFSCTATVTVVDTTAPKLTCPAPAPVECTGPETPVSFPDPVIGDNCGGSVDGCRAPSGSPFPLGVSDVTCNGRDGAGNGTSCSFQVTVQDTTPPAVTCPAPVIAECTSGGATVDPGAATASDLCGPVTVPRLAAQRYPLGVSKVTHTAVDQVGLVGSCTGTVEVRDTTPPAVRCPQQVVGECNEPLRYQIDRRDACDSDLGLTCDIPSGAALAAGDYSARCTATDHSGNAGSCGFPLTVKDTRGPVFDPKSLVGQSVIGDCGGAPVAFALPTARDACTTATVRCDALRGSRFGRNTVSCTATDAAGNVTRASIVVTVLEPLRVVFHRPLRDDNLANDVDSDADIANRFRAGQDLPHKVRLYGCGGYHLTRRAPVTVRLQVSAGERGQGAEVDGGLMMRKGGHYKLRLRTTRRDYTADVYRSLVTVSYDSAPGLVAGSEDARLVRVTGGGRDCVEEDDGDDDDDDRDDDDDDGRGRGRGRD